MTDPIRPSYEDLCARIAELQAMVIALSKENAALKDKLNLNSTNSSLPPSMDLKRPKRTKEPTGRKRGGQQGRQGVSRVLASVEEVDAIISLPPPSHCTCGGEVCAKEKIWRQQRVELPVIKPHITEYQRQLGRCSVCKKRVYAPLPADVAPNMMGPRLMAVASLLRGRFHLSVSKVQFFFKTLTGFNVSMGCLSQTEARVSESLAPVYEEIHTRAREAENLHMDETGYRQINKRGWAWLASNKEITLFKLSQSRGKKVAKEILGEDFEGIVVSDRYPAYCVVPLEKRQVCWAHVTRDFERFAGSEDELTAVIGQAFLAQKDRVFEALAQRNKGAWDTKKYVRTLASIRRCVRKILERGALMIDCKKMSGTCRSVLKVESALWRFTEYLWLDLTNNQAERDVRALVIGRKISYGTQSERGSRYIERLYSVIGTCHKQAIDIFDFLVEAIKATMNGQPPPHPFKA